MSNDDTLRHVESEIDRTFASSKLVNCGYAQAVWTLLSVNEDCFLKALASGTIDMHIFSDIHLNALTYPLRVCFHIVSDGNGPRTVYINDDYKLAWDWIEAAQDYSQFCSIFPLWHRGQIGLTVDGNRLAVDYRNERKHEYEAYNRLVRKEGKPDVQPPPPPHSILEMISAATTVRADSFRINFNPRLVAALVAWLAPAHKSRQTLPDDWVFDGFVLRDYRVVISTIQSMLFAWYQARHAVADAGVQGMGYISAVWIVGRDELFARLRRYTGVSQSTLERILSLLTFGSNGIRDPDIAAQPLIDLRNGSYALAPFVWLNSAAERNLCVLLNQILEQRRIYSDLKNEKENATRAEIIEALTPLGFAFGWGSVKGTNVDIAIVDHRNKACLCMELKWFIEPAEIREINARTRDLADGVAQAKTINALHARADKRLLKHVLKINAGYAFLSVVASQNWIGHDDVQDLDVPIIKVGHLLTKIQEVKALPGVIAWLKDRRYLPEEGTDYSIMPMEIACGEWRATWYGIQPHESSATKVI
jgi:hypothetical protein